MVAMNPQASATVCPRYSCVLAVDDEVKGRTGRKIPAGERKGSSSSSCSNAAANRRNSGGIVIGLARHGWNLRHNASARGAGQIRQVAGQELIPGSVADHEAAEVQRVHISGEDKFALDVTIVAAVIASAPPLLMGAAIVRRAVSAVMPAVVASACARGDRSQVGRCCPGAVIKRHKISASRQPEEMDLDLIRAAAAPHFDFRSARCVGWSCASR